MRTELDPSKQSTLDELRSQAALVQSIEDERKIQWETLRELALKAVILQKQSIASVAAIADVHRKTLTIWVQVRQAEMKAAARHAD